MSTEWRYNFLVQLINRLSEPKLFIYFLYIIIYPLLFDLLIIQQGLTAEHCLFILFFPIFLAYVKSYLL